MALHLDSLGHLFSRTYFLDQPQIRRLSSFLAFLPLCHYLLLICCSLAVGRLLQFPYLPRILVCDDDFFLPPLLSQRFLVGLAVHNYLLAVTLQDIPAISIFFLLYHLQANHPCPYKSARIVCSFLLVGVLHFLIHKLGPKRQYQPHSNNNKHAR